jgi:intracellular septation protein A
MATTSGASQSGGTAPARSGRLRSITVIVVFDIGAPLVAYKLLRSAGLSGVTSLVLSGVFPAIPVSIDAIRHRRVEVVGALVLAGILVGTVLGLLSHSTRLVLIEGSVPTGVLGAAFLGSLLARQPLMFTFAREFTGPDSAKGQEMTMLWETYEGFRHIFRIMTVVWGVGFLIEAGLRVVIVFNTSTGTALAISKVTPFVFVGILLAWTFAYGRHHRKRADRMVAAGDLMLPNQAQSPALKVTQATDQT